MEIVSAGSKPQVRVEQRKFCDDQGGGTIVDFYRNFIYNGATGALVSTNDTDISGAAYTVTGTAIECPPGGFDVENKVLVDTQADGSTVKFIRSYVYNPADGSLLSTSDTDFDGTAYTVTGTVGEFNPEQKCYEVNGRESLPLTDAAASSLTVPANTQYAEIQVQGGAMAFTVDGTTPVAGGTIGFKVFDCGQFKIGCGDLDNLGAISELADFEAIALTGETARLEIIYYSLA